MDNLSLNPTGRWGIMTVTRLTLSLNSLVYGQFVSFYSLPGRLQYWLVCPAIIPTGRWGIMTVTKLTLSLNSLVYRQFVLVLPVIATCQTGVLTCLSCKDSTRKIAQQGESYTLSLNALFYEQFVLVLPVTDTCQTGVLTCLSCKDSIWRER